MGARTPPESTSNTMVPVHSDASKIPQVSPGIVIYEALQSMRNRNQLQIIGTTFKDKLSGSRVLSAWLNSTPRELSSHSSIPCDADQGKVRKMK